MDKDQLQKISDIMHELDHRAARALQEQDYDEALLIYEKILEAQENMKLEKFCGHTLINMANIYLVKGDYETALLNVEKAAALGALQRDAKDLGNLHILQANIFFLMDRAGEGEELLLQEVRKNRDNGICGEASLALFSYYVRTKKYAKARSFADKAINYFRTAGNKENLRRAISCRIDYFKLVGQAQYARYDEAELATL